LIVAILPPVAGGFVAGMLAISDAYGLAATSLLPATALALFAAVAIEVGGRRLLADNPLRVAVLGSPTFAAGLSREIEADSAQAVEVVGWLNPTAAAPVAGSPEAEGQADGSQIGTLDSIRAAITEHEIDLIVRGPGLGGSRRSRRTYDAIAEGCVDLPVRMIDGNQFYEQLFGHVPLGTIGSDWFLYIMHPSFQGTPPATKRVFDLVGAGLASLFALPLIGLAALAIKLEDRGPVFYRQRRVGEGGREYEILKLRSMTADAEAGGAQWSSAGDTRITRVGRVLRRTHIDELPQLINVLRGEMTLVGPRPERPEMIAELERLFPHYKRRLLVKPGVTGWAQVRCGYGGSDIGSAWKLCHDLYYLKRRSVLFDLLIMLETLSTVAVPEPINRPDERFIVAARAGDELAPPVESLEPT
jgi:exopolysaccharide biosynthesis polyprenyl glycosylphosphotransferase